MFTPDLKDSRYTTPFGDPPKEGDVLVSTGAGNFYWLPTNRSKLDEMIAELYDRWNFGDGLNETKRLLDFMIGYRDRTRCKSDIDIHGLATTGGVVRAVMGFISYDKEKL